MLLSELKKIHGDVDVQVVDINDYDIMLCGIRKPKLKKIDMSVCIESGIDCEFSDLKSDYGHTYIGNLLNIISGIEDKYVAKIDNYSYCRPRMNHVHGCPDGFDKCPLPEGFEVRYWWPVGLHNIADSRMIVNDNTQWQDITHFEVTGIADGWEL